MRRQIYGFVFWRYVSSGSVGSWSTLHRTAPGHARPEALCGMRIAAVVGRDGFVDRGGIRRRKTAPPKHTLAPCKKCEAIIKRAEKAEAKQASQDRARLAVIA